jgi:hypothetical protein
MRIFSTSVSPYIHVSWTHLYNGLVFWTEEQTTDVCTEESAASWECKEQSMLSFYVEPSEGQGQILQHCVIQIQLELLKVWSILSDISEDNKVVSSKQGNLC